MNHRCTESYLTPRFGMYFECCVWDAKWDGGEMKLLGKILALAALTGTVSYGSAAAVQAASVRLRWVAQAQFAGVYVAKAKGFYREAGLDMTINPGGPNISVEPLVASGADTFGIAGAIDSMLYAREKKLPLVCIGMSQQASAYAFVAHSSSGINTVKDFKGKTVAAWFTGSQYTLYSTLAHEGLKPGDMNVVAQPFSMQPFIDKQYDVATVTLYNELNTLRGQGVTDFRVFKADDFGVKTQMDAIVTSEKVIRERPGEVQGFLDATLKGWKYAFEHKAEAVDIVMAAGSGLDRKHQEHMLDEIEKLMLAHSGRTKGLGFVDLEVVKSVEEQLLAYKALKAPVDLKPAFDASFWNKVPDANKKL